MTFDVIVDGVEGALCALSHDGVSYGAAFTDAGGTATINIDGVLPANEDALVTVTFFNASPYLGSVQVGEAYAAIIDVAPSFFSVSMEGGGTATDTLTISNVGEPLSVLNYAIEIVDAGMTRDSDGSGITVDPAECEPGTTLDLVFTLANEGTDGEWVDGARLGFPDGVVVNSSTDFVVSDRALRWRGASEDGALTWEGNWWNVVYPGETAVATINVTVDAAFTRNVGIVFGLQGDGHGEPPHSLSGTLVIDCGVDPRFTVLTPNGNEAWGVGEARDITWDPSGMPVLVDILCSVDGGGNWTTVVDSTDNDGEYTWMVDAPVSDDCLVKVSMTADPRVNDVCDASFSIYQPVEWLSVTPAGGAVAEGAAASVEVQFDTAGMAEGDYHADLVITNSGGEPVVIPVTLCVATTGTDDRIPQKAVVYGNFPNPFHPSTRIAFSIPETMRVTVLVYSVDGRLVRTLTDDIYGAGRHVVPWNGKDAAGESASDGVYFYKLVADGTELTGKMVLLR